MTSMFVTYYRPTDAWLALPRQDRQALIDFVLVALDDLPAQGVEVLAWGLNDTMTDKRAPYDAFCVYRVRDEGTQRRFEDAVRASDWYKYFDQTAASGKVMTAAEVLEVFHAMPQAD